MAPSPSPVSLDCKPSSSVNLPLGGHHRRSQNHRFPPSTNEFPNRGVQTPPAGIYLITDSDLVGCGGAGNLNLSLHLSGFSAIKAGLETRPQLSVRINVLPNHTGVAGSPAARPSCQVWSSGRLPAAGPASGTRRVERPGGRPSPPPRDPGRRRNGATQVSGHRGRVPPPALAGTQDPRCCGRGGRGAGRPPLGRGTRRLVLLRGEDGGAGQAAEAGPEQPPQAAALLHRAAYRQLCAARAPARAGPRTGPWRRPRSTP
jgi:hypothetical protein